MAESVEQRRFPGVGIAHQRHRAERHGLAGLTAQRPLAPQRFDVLADAADALADAPAIGLELLLAWAARANAAAQAREILIASRKARQQIIKLRQLDLELAFAAPRMARKNVENQLGAVNNAAVEAPLEIALLYGREIAVENDQGDLVGLSFRANLVQFSAAHESRRVHRIAHLQDAAGHYGACATRQFGELGERLASRFRRPLRRAARVRGALQAQPYQEDALVRVSASCGLHSGRQAATRGKSCDLRERRSLGRKKATEE
jgi:hypothetical protein